MTARRLMLSSLALVSLTLGCKTRDTGSNDVVSTAGESGFSDPWWACGRVEARPDNSLAEGGFFFIPHFNKDLSFEGTERFFVSSSEHTQNKRLIELTTIRSAEGGNICLWADWKAVKDDSLTIKGSSFDLTLESRKCGKIESRFDHSILEMPIFLVTEDKKTGESTKNLVNITGAAFDEFKTVFSAGNGKTNELCVLANWVDSDPKDAVVPTASRKGTVEQRDHHGPG